MESIVVAKELEIKQWIREIVMECLASVALPIPEATESFVSREDIAAFLDGISLVTLHAWMKQGLPYHKQGGRVYFLKSEVVEYIQRKK